MEMVPNKKLPKSAIDAICVMTKDFFSNILCSISILAIILKSTAFFSTLRRLKTYLRSSSNENHLTCLVLKLAHRNIPINIEEIINVF